MLSCTADILISAAHRVETTYIWLCWHFVADKRNNISLFVNSAEELVYFLFTKKYTIRLWSGGHQCNE